MKYYELHPNDQRDNNWLMYCEQYDDPYLTLKPRYIECVCVKCRAIDHDRAFAEGFDQGLKIRARGDLLITSEGFYCFSDKVRSVIEAAGFQGLSLKVIPGTGWHVVNAVCRVEADRSAYAATKPFCDSCGRPKELIGLIRCIDQIQAPATMGTFFAPVFDRRGSMNGDRDLFLTEDILLHFKSHGIKGGMCARLLTGAEYAAVKAAGALKNPLKWPRGSGVSL